jgi:PAS domain S-box-containing protein
MIPSGKARSLVFRYGFAVVVATLAVGLRLILSRLLGHQFPFAILNLSLMLIAWYAGTLPAVAALALGAAGTEIFVLGHLRTLGAQDTTGLMFFLVTGLALSILVGKAHRVRRQAEMGAETSRLREALIDQAFEPVLMWAWEGPILLWNRGAEQLYGYSREEAIGRVSHDLLQTEAAGGVKDFTEAMERQGRWEGELKHTSRDGKTIFVDSHMVLVREADRAYVIEANRDITERKKREMELRRLNDQLEALVNGVSDHAISMLDPEGIILTRNRGAELMDGYTAEEIIGRRYAWQFTPASILEEAPARELARAAVEGKVEIEGWRSRKDGSTFWANGTLAALYDQDGKTQGFANIMRDRTTKRHDDE